MSKEIVKDKEYPNGWKLTAYINPSKKPSTTKVEDKIIDFGQYEAADGTIVQGVFQNNKLNGVGFTKHIDGQEYLGMYKDDIRHGMGSVYLGNKLFTGEFENGKVAGFGEIELLAENPSSNNIGVDLSSIKIQNVENDPDETYKVLIRGNFNNMKLNGFGEIINQKTGVIMKGEFKDDKMNGYGVLTVDGESYIGNFVNGKKEGEGQQLNKNGLGYIGDYKAGNKEGWGIESYEEGQYTGQFQNGEKTGLAETFDDDGQYLGGVLNGKPHGFGTYNGDDYQYTGEYKNGKFHGLGLFQSPEYQYFGNYTEGEFDGVGMKLSGNEYYKGEYKMGVKDGKALFRDLAGKVHSCIFENNISKSTQKVSKEEIDALTGHLDMGKYQNDIAPKIADLEDKIFDQKDRLEEITEGTTSDFKKKSQALQSQCTDLVNDYNQTIDQYNKKLDNFSARAYKDQIQINVWDRTCILSGDDSEIKYRPQDQLDVMTQKKSAQYLKTNKGKLKVTPNGAEISKPEEKVKVEETKPPKEVKKNTMKNTEVDKNNPFEKTPEVKESPKEISKPIPPQVEKKDSVKNTVVGLNNPLKKVPEVKESPKVQQKKEESVLNKSKPAEPIKVKKSDVDLTIKDGESESPSQKKNNDNLSKSINEKDTSKEKVSDSQMDEKKEKEKNEEDEKKIVEISKQLSEQPQKEIKEEKIEINKELPSAVVKDIQGSKEDPKEEPKERTKNEPKEKLKGESKETTKDEQKKEEKIATPPKEHEENKLENISKSKADEISENNQAEMLSSKEDKSQIETNSKHSKFSNEKNDGEEKMSNFQSKQEDSNTQKLSETSNLIQSKSLKEEKIQGDPDPKSVHQSQLNERKESDIYPESFKSDSKVKEGSSIPEILPNSKKGNEVDIQLKEMSKQNSVNEIITSRQNTIREAYMEDKVPSLKIEESPDALKRESLKSNEKIPKLDSKLVRSPHSGIHQSEKKRRVPEMETFPQSGLTARASFNPLSQRHHGNNLKYANNDELSGDDDFKSYRESLPLHHPGTPIEKIDMKVNQNMRTIPEVPTSPKEELYIEEDEYDPNVIHGELTIVENETDTNLGPNTIFTTRGYPIVTERSNLLTSGRGNPIHSTREFKNNFKGSVSPRKATTSRPKLKKDRKVGMKNPNMVRTIVVQYHTTILDRDGNPIDQTVEQDIIEDDTDYKNFNPQNLRPIQPYSFPLQNQEMAKKSLHEPAFIEIEDPVYMSPMNTQNKMAAPYKHPTATLNSLELRNYNQRNRSASRERKSSKRKRKAKKYPRKSSLQKSRSPKRLNRSRSIERSPSKEVYENSDSRPEWNRYTIKKHSMRRMVSPKKRTLKHLYRRSPSKYGDILRINQVEEELNLIREEPEFRNMTIEEYKEILDIERDMIRNLNLRDAEYLSSEQLHRMKKLTNHFNYILDMRMRNQIKKARKESRLPRRGSRSRSRSKSVESYRTYESLEDLKDRYLELKYTYYEALRTSHDMKLQPHKYKFNSRRAGGLRKDFRNREYGTPDKYFNKGGKKTKRSRSKDSPHKQKNSYYKIGRSRSRSKHNKIGDNLYYGSKLERSSPDTKFYEKATFKNYHNNELIDVQDFIDNESNYSENQEDYNFGRRKRNRKRKSSHGYAQRYMKFKNLGGRRF